jgi:sulfate transport system substrate-binding protein
MRKWFIIFTILLFTVSSFTQAQENEVTLTLAGFAVPREAYGKIIPLFQAYWLEETGQTVIFEESYLASGAQSRAVIGGFEADIVALSLEDHVTRIADAGLITADWQANANNGMVSASVAVLLVRPDNPSGITDWADVVGRGLSVITPNPATSGAGQWNVMAAYGAAYRGFVDGYSADAEGALQFITALYTDVLVMDADGRESFLTFERGIGDVAITYENEYYAGVNAGNEDLYDVVYPSSTILIENPIAVVDMYADKHGVREVADAFVAFTYTPEAQAIFAESGFRPPYERVFTPSEVEGEPDVLTLVPTIELDEERFPPIEDLFVIDTFGGWAEVVPTFFGDDGIFTKMITDVKG